MCCLFVITDGSSTISQNCTYIQNPGFPSVYSSTSGLTYTVAKCSSDVCSLCLDFETFSILGPGSTLEDAAHTCLDTFTVTGTSGQSTPVICGMNSGQHIYMDVGPAEGATGTITFNFATTSSTSRQWEIKVTQIPCWQSRGRDSGCLQYHTGITGRLESFNFQEPTSTSQMHLESQDYDICIRQEDGYCCIRYSLCPDDRSWAINNAAAAANMALSGSKCTADYVGIEGVSQQCNSASNGVQVNKICGSAFGISDGDILEVSGDAAYVCGKFEMSLIGLSLHYSTRTELLNLFIHFADCTAPFRVHIRTNEAASATPNDGNAPTAAIQPRGVCLQYQQLAC